MKKQFSFFIIACMVLTACGSENKQGATKPVASTDTTAQKQKRFLPVTNFLRGDLVAINQKGVNPLKITKSGEKVDSTWLTLAQLPLELAEFLRPVIDSTNLVGLFKETSFQDQTINTFTFTYEPLGQLPDTMTLRRWDVYVDADQQTIKKIYMVKQIADNNKSKTLQLTWEVGKRCKMITLNEEESAVEKDVTILWDF